MINDKINKIKVKVRCRTVKYTNKLQREQFSNIYFVIS